MAYLLRLIVLLISFFFASAACALPKVPAFSISGSGYAFTDYSKEAVCQAAGPSIVNQAFTYVSASVSPSGTCVAVSRENGTYSSHIYPTSSCPANSHASGSSCVCATNYTENPEGNACIQKSLLCEPGYKLDGFGDCIQINHDRSDCFAFSLSGQMPGGDLVIDYRYSGSVADGSKFCVGVEDMTNPGRGCTVTFNRTALLDYGGGKFVSEGNLSMSADSNMVDQSCALNPSPPDPTKKPEPPEEKCKNGYSGQVNGVTVCVAKVPESGVGDETKETQSDDGTDTKKVKTEKNTTCTNGVCTTVTTVTTTTTNNASGVSNTTTQTSATTQGKGTFCEENPSFKLCKGGEEDGSNFGGSCGGGFTCEGDAIQCAIAQEQHRRACKLFDDTSEESQLYQSNKGKEGNQTTNLPGNETVNVAGRIDSSDALGASAAGVADLNVTVWGRSISLPFSMLNPYLAQLGNVLLAVSFLLALRIVARG